MPPVRSEISVIETSTSEGRLKEQCDREVNLLSKPFDCITFILMMCRTSADHSLSTSLYSLPCHDKTDSRVGPSVVQIPVSI